MGGVAQPCVTCKTPGGHTTLGGLCHTCFTAATNETPALIALYWKALSEGRTLRPYQEAALRQSHRPTFDNLVGFWCCALHDADDKKARLLQVGLLDEVSLLNLVQEYTVSKGGTQKFPSVTVLSERPASTGRVVKGQSGTGVIMPDEPDVVYVTSQANASAQWYGHWPIEETDIGEVLRRGQNRIAIEDIAGTDEARTYVTYDGRLVRRDIYFTLEEDPELAYLVATRDQRLPGYRAHAVIQIYHDPENGLTEDEVLQDILPGIRRLREQYIGLNLKEAKDVVTKTRDYYTRYGRLPSQEST